MSREGRPTTLEVHEAMQNAPHDGEPYRQARAAINAVTEVFASDRREADAELTEVAELVRAWDAQPPESPGGFKATYDLCDWLRRYDSKHGG
jgi:hypothetical protein